MKKILMIIILFFPFIVLAEQCNTDKINISAIAITSRTNNVEELSETEAKGKNINMNLSMSEVGDNIKYKITLKNESGEDYELDKNSFSIDSDYIDYKFESDDKNSIIKANSSKTFYLTVTYKKEVPSNLFKNGKYNDNKKMLVNLQTDNTIIEEVVQKNIEDIKNPNTRTGVIIKLAVIVVILTSIILLILKLSKQNKYLLLIGLLAIIPISVYAICKCEINIESKVEIVKKDKACLYVGPANCTPDYTNYEKKFVDYIVGTKVKDFIAKEQPIIIKEIPMDEYDFIKVTFFKKGVEECEDEINSAYYEGNISNDEHYNGILACHQQFVEDYDEDNNSEFMNSEVKPSTEGCYDFTYLHMC